MMIPLISSIMMLTVNLITTESIVRKKYKFHIRLTYILIFTIGLLFFTHYIFPTVFKITLKPYTLVFVSWLYIFVLKQIYLEHFKTLISIMAFTFCHTLLINGLSYHLLNIIYLTHQRWLFIFIQLGLYIITTPMVIKHTKQLTNTILTVHENSLKYSFLLPLLNFAIIFFSRFILVFNNFLLMIVYYLIIASMILVSYVLIHNLSISVINNRKLTNLAYLDPLTKIKNRLALYHDFMDICKDKRHCYLYYLDLNQLKKINDRYGHLQGDNYLKSFSNSLVKSVKSKDQVYRVSGDEFVVITDKKTLTIDQLKYKIEQHFKFNHPFNGVSIGEVYFPKDATTLDELLNIADKMMYKDKKNKE